MTPRHTHVRHCNRFTANACVQDKIDELCQQLELATKHRGEAEKDSEEIDKKLTDALKRVALLECGQYGLTEAVGEIKGLLLA